MALENGLASLEEKIDTLIGLFQQDIELRKASLEKVSEAVAKSAGTSAKKETTAAAAEKKETAKAEASGDDKMAEAKKLVAKYVGGTDRDEERSARNKKVVGLLSHEKIKKADAPEKVKDLKDVNPKALASVIKNLEKYINDGDLTTPPAADEDDDVVDVD